MTCDRCGQEHLHRYNGPSCTKHVDAPADDGTVALRPCKNFRRKGQDICGYHGGAAPRALVTGRRNETERKAAKMADRLAVPIKTNATDALLGQIEVWAGLEAFYARKVAEAQEAGGDDALVWGKTKDKTGGDDAGTTHEAAPNVWITLHERASDRLAKMCVDSIRIGIEEKRVRLAAQQGEVVAGAIRGIAESILAALQQAGLTPALAEVFNTALVEAAPRHLRLLTGGAA